MKHGLQEGADFYKTSKFDVILIGLVLFLSVVSILWFTRTRIRQSSEPKVALIYQKDKLLEEVKLDNDNAISILNGRMQIEIKGRRIRVVNSDCPQHICVNMGWIKYSGQTIVCVPNKVVIEIKSAGSPLLDAVVY